MAGHITDFLFGEDLEAVLSLVESDSSNKTSKSMVTETSEMQTEETEAQSFMKYFKTYFRRLHYCQSHPLTQSSVPFWSTSLPPISAIPKRYSLNILEVYFQRWNVFFQSIFEVYSSILQAYFKYTSGILLQPIQLKEKYSSRLYIFLDKRSTFCGIKSAF